MNTNIPILDVLDIKPKLRQENIRNTIDTFSMKTMSLKRFGDFMYACSIGSPDIPEDSLIRRDSVIRYRIIRTYLAPIQNFEVDESFFIVSNIENCKKFYHMVHKTCNKIMHKFNITGCRWRINIGNSDIYFYLEIDNGITLNIVYFNSDTKTCTVSVLSMNSVYNETYHGVTYYLARKENRIHKEFEGSNFIRYGSVDPISFGIILKSCEMYLKYGNPSATFAELKDKQLEHSFLQRDLVGLLLNKDGIYDNILIQLVSWSPNEYINECDVDMILPSCLNDDNKNYPIISLSDSEWGKVEKYINKNYPETCDIERVFQNTRYGVTLCARYIDDNVDILVKCTCDTDEDGNMHLYILYEEMKNIIPILDFVIDKPEEFDGWTNVESIQYGFIHKKNSRELISGWKELGRYLPNSIFIDIDNMFTVIYKYVCLQIMLFDRPEKVRCVRSEKRSDSKNAVAYAKSDNNYVTERVIMYAPTAKEYIKKMSIEHMDREYTIESWTRVGHYRRKPGSHEKIWIGPTTCKRHLPLTEKEIRIRL